MQPEVPGSGSGGGVPEGTAPLWPPPRPREPASPRGSFEGDFPAAGGTDTVPGLAPARAWRRRRAGGKRAHLVIALTLGLAGLAVSVFGVATQLLPRTFTPSQRQQIQTWEMSRRWRAWPAGRIFPRVVSYQLSGSLFGGGRSVTLRAVRIGMDSDVQCRSALDPAALRVFGRHACLSVLRATYGDATQTLVVTVGVVVTPSPAAARAASAALPRGERPRPGVRPAPFRRTPAAGFRSAQRQLTWRRATGPYLVMATVGYADGRRRVPGADPYLQGEMSSLAGGLGQAVAGSLGAPPPPPQCPGGPAC